MCIRCKQKSRYQTYKLVKINGIKVRKTCDECGSKDNVVYHHDNYNRPDLIRFLCAKCHTKYHNNNPKQEFKMDNCEESFEYVGFKIDVETKKKFEERCKLEERSISGMIRHLIKVYLGEEDNSNE